MKDPDFAEFMYVNVCCRLAAPSNQADQDLGGIYQVDFNFAAWKLTPEKLAAIALDIFHSHIRIGVIADFVVDALDEDNMPIWPDDLHIEGSASTRGEVKQISFLPFYFEDCEALSCTS
jgi:hypothetical protein